MKLHRRQTAVAGGSRKEEPWRDRAPGSRRSRVHLLGVLVVSIVVASPFVSSCNLSLNNNFADVANVNFISTRGFDSGDWRVDAASDNPSFNYLVFSHVTNAAVLSAVGTAGLPDAADGVWRLELVNLMPNGDFGQTTPGNAPAGWTVGGTGAASATAVVESGTSSTVPIDASTYVQPIDGNTFFFNLPQNSYDAFDLSANPGGLLDGYVTNAVYDVHLSIRFGSYQKFVLENNDGTDANTALTWYTGSPSSNWQNTTYEFPDDFPSSGTVSLTASVARHYLSLNSLTTSYNPSNGAIDNIRIVRSDFIPSLRLDIPYRETGRPDLPDAGTYRFSFYVHSDPTGNDGAFAVANRYAASYVSLGVKAAQSDGTFGADTPTGKPDTWSAGWTLVSTDVLLQNVDPGAGNYANNVIELSISPTDLTANSLYYLEPGSLLIADPSLEFIPNP